MKRAVMGGLLAALLALQAAWADADADRRNVESMMVALKALAARQEREHGRDANLKRAEALIRSAESKAARGDWDGARAAQEEAKAVLAVSVEPTAPANAVARAPERPDVSEGDASLRRMAEGKLNAAQSLLGVARARGGAERSLGYAERMIHAAEQAAATQDWAGELDALQAAVAVLSAALHGDAAPGLAPSQDGGTEGEDQRVYRSRREGAQALLDAIDRMAAEPGKARFAASVRDGAAEKLGRADAMAAAGDHRGARVLVDQAHAVLHTGIESLRGGQTVVHERKFASKADEYAYELDRNDSHLMMVRMFLKWDGEQPLKALEQAHLDDARALRRRAEALAAAGEHAGAVEAMEGSTAAIFSLLRAAGVALPGG